MTDLCPDRTDTPRSGYEASSATANGGNVAAVCLLSSPGCKQTQTRVTTFPVASRSSTTPTALLKGDFSPLAIAAVAVSTIAAAGA